MKRQHYADVVRRFVREARPDLAAPPPAGEPLNRERLVSAVEVALRARARRRVLVRRAAAATGLTFAAAAALALVVGQPWRRTPTTIAASPARSRALTVLGGADEARGAVVAGAAGAPVAIKGGMAIAAGLTLRAPATGEVRIGTADGTALALEGGGELSVTESGATQRFALRAGAVTARVSRLFAGERFIVDTRDAEVEVHGTSFRVAVVSADPRCGDGTTTRVSVFEGVVRVRAGGRQVDLTPGGVWPAGCETAPARAETARDVAPPVAHHHAQAVESREPAPPPAVAPPAAAPSVAPTPAPPPTSSLGAENDLFAAAVHARRQGHAEEAARLFAELVAAHPASPLVESAMAQRMKALAPLDPAAAARAAAAYLERFPNGFASPEARALARQSSP